MKRRTSSTCPICYTLDIFGDRWTLLIIRDVLRNGKRRFGEFLESPEAIATNVLTTRLRDLVELGVLVRNDDPLDRRQGVYEPTAKALALAPVLDGLMTWGLAHGPEGLVVPPPVSR